MSIECIETMAEMLESGTMLYMEQGLENVDTHEMGAIIDMIKDLAEAKYYCQITEAMEEAEYGVDYDERGRRFYGRKNPEYRMTPEMYHEHSAEEMRDMDRKHGRMYYTEMSKYEMAKKHYSEGKSTHPLNDEENMNRAGVYADTIADEIREIMPNMSQSEKTLIRQRMLNLANELM